jgi:hypothetical protein
MPIPKRSARSIISKPIRFTEKVLLDINVLRFSLQLLFRTVFVPINIYIPVMLDISSERDKGLHAKYKLFLVRYYQKLECVH